MDRRSWPWKKKSSDKTIVTADTSASGATHGENEVDKGELKTVSYMQISVEAYTHLKEQEDQVKVLNEKLSVAQNEMITKENLVKQHAKVAEEAISGWEKAEAEAAALKSQLESVTLLKLTAEERASHLDSALKECMKQIRNVKEEGEQKLQDVVFAKTKKWEEIKAELEGRIADFEQELLRASAENAALSRSLQERSNILMKVSDEKALAESEIEVLKSNLEAYEREVSSLKYELHVIAKELEIRNEEKNMSMRSADVANKQHLEDVKKICKLEAECQRLRGLVRKKLPGPAALAQMKLEVENLGRDYGETRMKRSPAKGSSMHHVSAPDFARESIQHIQKENEFLTERLVSMEEETKMLKEALSQRNSELQTSKSMYAKAANKLRVVETQMQTVSQRRSPSKMNLDVSMDITMSQSESNPPSLTSMSEDGIDEEGSCSESCTTALISELSHFSKQKDTGKPHNAVNSNHLELMDDFLEMEKLACLTEPNESVSNLDAKIDKMKTDDQEYNSTNTKLVDVTEKQQLKTEARNLPYEKHPQGETTSSKMDSSVSELKTKISSIFESQDHDSDIDKLLQDIKRILEDAHLQLPQHSISCTKESQSLNSTDQQYCGEDKSDSITSNNHSDFWSDPNHVYYQKLEKAINEIHDFVMFLGGNCVEIKHSSSSSGDLSEQITVFCSSCKEVLSNQRNLINFVLDLSHILSEASNMSSNLCNDKANEGENNMMSDCIDKVTLLENKVVHHEQGKDNFTIGSPLSHSSSHPEIDRPIGENFEAKATKQNFFLDEIGQLKLEKVNMEMELASCTNLLEEAKNRLNETERNMEELKSQLVSSQKSNGLAETQLKCMVESYKLLESRTQELESELNQLRTNAEALSNELELEKLAHQEYLNKCKDLEEQFEQKTCSKCSAADTDNKTKQETDIAAAAEKLAECQETILMLGKQLQALRPQTEQIDSSINSRYLVTDEPLEDVTGPSHYIAEGMLGSKYSGQSDIESTGASITSRNGESPLYIYNSEISPSDNESSNSQRSPINSKRPKHRPRSSSSSSLPNAVPERHGRGGISRFFSKGH